MVFEYHIRFEGLRECEAGLRGLTASVFCVLEIVFVAIDEQVAPLRCRLFLMRRW